VNEVELGETTDCLPDVVFHGAQTAYALFGLNRQKAKLFARQVAVGPSCRAWEALDRRLDGVHERERRRVISRNAEFDRPVVGASRGLRERQLVGAASARVVVDRAS
jgi:hypothetical protein